MTFALSLVSSIVILPVVRTGLLDLDATQSSYRVARGCDFKSTGGFHQLLHGADDVAVIEGIFNCIALARD